MQDTDQLEAVSTLSIRLFGAFEIRIDGQTITTRTPKDLRLLAYLVYKHDSELEREALANTFWGKTDPNGINKEPNGIKKDQGGIAIEADRFRQKELARLLTQALTSLGRGLGQQRWRITKPTPQTLRFDTAHATLDLTEFETALRIATPEALLSVLDLYRSAPFLEGWNDPWIVAARAQFEQSYLTALENAAHHASEAGDPNRAQRCLETVMQIRPWRQSAWRLLLSVLAKARRFKQLRRLYADFQARCRQQQQALEPETQQHYLKLLSEMEQFAHQVESGWLPEPLTCLIGRDDEVREVADLVRTRRLVTLTGTGGIGKSRLALRVAREIEEEFYDRAWFIDLSAATDARLVLQQLVATLRLQPTGADLHHSVIDALRGRQMLLILDNCEHLLEACADLCNRLAQACHSITILATSRQALGVMGEAIWEVPSLPFPDPERHATLEEIAAFGAVQLFVERACLPQRRYSLDDENRMAVAQICQYLRGLPLALELAAARVTRPSWSAQRVGASLHRSLEVLTLGARTAPSRHQTLRATIDWSYGLLDEVAQRVFVRLSLFRGGCTVEAAVWVLEEPETEEVLGRLCDQSLLTAEADRSGGMRFRMLETLREFAAERYAEQTPPEEQTRLAQRHADFFLHLAEEAAPHLRGQEQVLWLSRLAAEHDNLRAALEWLLTNQQAQESLRLGTALTWFWRTRGHIVEGRDWLLHSLALSEMPTKERAYALRAAGNLAADIDDFSASTALYNECLLLAQKLEDDNLIARTLYSLGHNALAVGHHADARCYLDASLQLLTSQSDKGLLADVLHKLGSILLVEAEFDRAGDYFRRGLDLLRELGHRRSIAISLLNVGHVYYSRGDTKQAQACYEESFQILVDLGDAGPAAGVQTCLGRCAYDAGRDEEARSLLETSLATNRRLRYRVHEAQALYCLGDLELRYGNVKAARDCYSQSLILMRSTGTRSHSVRLLLAFARLAQRECRLERAAGLLGAIAAVMSDLGMKAISMDPVDREEHVQLIATTRAALGEEVFSTHWTAGNAQSWEAAVAYALEAA